MLRNFNTRLRFSASAGAVALVLLFGVSHAAEQELVLNTIYGKYTISEPVIIELIQDPLIQRLKDVRQLGVDYYSLKNLEFTRYDHSIGVFVLSRRYGAGLKEQIASLLHDASHTVFSHVADFMFDRSYLKNCYQDDIHEHFLENSTIKAILEKYGLKVKDVLAKNKLFTILETDIPNICADRLDYNLREAYLEEQLTEEDIHKLLDDLKFENNNWFFISQESAKKFGIISFYKHLDESRWGSVGGILRNIWASEILHKALEINVLTLDDIHYGIDTVVWQKLQASNSSFINNKLKKLCNFRCYYQINNKDYDTIIKGKFRAIDPLVKVGQNLVRLTELDQDFKQEFNNLKNKITQGWRVKFLSD